MRRSVLDRCLRDGFAFTKSFFYTLLYFENGLRYVVRRPLGDVLSPVSSPDDLVVWSEYFPVGGDDCGSSR